MWLLRSWCWCGTLLFMQNSLFPPEKSLSQKESNETTDNRFDPDIYADLNPAQHEAVTTMDGPVLVIAGAGSGKTRTLIYRLAHLVDQKIAPEKILLLTFTRKAAQEMLHRAAFLMKETCCRVNGGTFHSVASNLLRHYGYHLGYSANFTILDRSDSEGIINLLKSSLDLGGEGKKFPSKRVVMNIISGAVNKSVSINELMENRYAHLLDHEKDILLIRDHYQQFKFDHGLMDYDDLLVNLKKLLSEFPDIRKSISNLYSHIMVDEYQDTNLIQAEIVTLLADNHNNVMVVGDDAQSIYSFRGANFRNIMDFPELFPQTKIVKLEENYRSSQSILNVTNEIISQAEERFTKKLFSRIDKGPKPILYAAQNEDQQARYVTGQILDLKRKGGDINKIAVLFRSSFHSYKLELELTNHHLSFEKRGGQKLTESAHMKDVLSFMRISCNPQDNLSWNRVLLQLDKVGPKTAQKILTRIKTSDDPLSTLKKYPAAKGWKNNFIKLVELLEKLFNLTNPLEVYELVMNYYQPIFERIYHDDYPGRTNDLEQLKDILKSYDDLQNFLDDSSLDPPEAQTTGSKNETKLVLSTIHSAKGLEWDTIFVINLAQGKFPASYARWTDEIEEERRLLYVASTRARKNLYFVYPREILNKERQLIPATMSQFLEHLSRDLLNHPGSFTSFKPSPRSAKQKVSISLFPPGTVVKHGFFGKGTVIAIAGPRSVDVEFSGHGLKTLHLDYAKLKIID